MKKISIGICCYNEEKNIKLMYSAIVNELSKLNNYDYEIIFEDNASTDKSQIVLREIAQKDRKVKVILNQANFGPARSGTNCMLNSTGDAFIALPCDFQEPPEMIIDFVKEWELGYDIVWGQKENSDESATKRTLRTIYYWVINLLSDFPQFMHVTGFGLLDKKVIDTIMPTKIQDPEISTRHLVVEYGFRTKLIPYTQKKRLNGVSSYNISRYYAFAITSLCNTSIKPLRLMTVLGFVVGVISMIIGGIYFIYKLLFWNTFSVGTAPILILMCFLGSIQLFCTGILGEYVSILLRKVMNKPIVIEKEKLNFENTE